MEFAKGPAMKRLVAPAELVGLPGVPGTVQGIWAMALREGWPREKRQGRGGGFAYPIEALPPETQAAYLFKPATNAPPVKDAVATPAPNHEHFERLPDKTKEEARRRAHVLDAVNDMIARGASRMPAITAAADHAGEHPNTIRNWFRSVRGLVRADWLPALAPRYAGRTASVPCSPEAWDFFKADYLRASRPAASACYERTQRVADALRFLAVNAAEAASGNQEAAEAFRAAGIKITDARGKLKGTDQLFFELSDAFAKSKNEAAVLKVAMVLLGRAGGELVPFMKQGAAEIRKLGDEAARLGLVIDEETLKAGDEFGDKFETLGKVLRSVAFAIGNTLIPVLQPVIQEFTEWTASIKPLIKLKVAEWIEDVRAALPAIKTAALEAIDGVKLLVGWVRFLGDRFGYGRVAAIALALFIGGPLITAVFGVITSLLALAGTLTLVALKLGLLNFIGVRAGIIGLVGGLGRAGLAAGRFALVMGAQVVAAIVASGVAAASFVAQGVAGLVAGFGRAALAARAFTLALLANPVTAIVAGIALAAVLIIQYWEPITAFFADLWAGVEGLFTSALAAIVGLFAGFDPLLLLGPFGLAARFVIDNWTPISGFFADLWASVGDLFVSALAAIVGLFAGVDPLLLLGPFGLAARLVINNWTPISGFFGEALGTIANLFAGLDAAALIAGFVAAAALLRQAWGGIVDFFKGIWDEISAVFAAGARAIARVLPDFVKRRLGIGETAAAAAPVPAVPAPELRAPAFPAPILAAPALAFRAPTLAPQAPTLGPASPTLGPAGSTQDGRGASRAQAVEGEVIVRFVNPPPGTRVERVRSSGPLDLGLDLGPTMVMP